ncbi:MAG: tryptophan--tRNA ligase [bacterium]|nr:tryptophan--tRNA ligase [bacterium]
MAKEVILTGIRANNDLHIGNYLGAIFPIVDMAKKKSADYQINLFVPDLHSFTTPIDHSKLQEQIMHNLRVFVAAGLPLGNDNIRIYRQSYISAHSELTWILDCFTGIGEMSRMTQYKEKSTNLEAVGSSSLVEETNGPISYDQMVVTANEQQRNRRISVGLFNYPVLMAADILLYSAKYVPVGDDQTQHLEFTRLIANRMNALPYLTEPLFTVPLKPSEQHEFFGKDQGLRIRDLADPAKKMSKSDDTGKGVIFLTDSPQIASRKIMSATTDSLEEVKLDYNQRPGVSNLLDLLKLFGGNPDDFIGHTQYGPLKEAVANRVGTFLGNFQVMLADVNETIIVSKLEADEAAMNEIANATLLKVQKAVGLRPV